MKLISARFENFRLLRDVEIEFSRDSNKRLTVIRAANESGKTTIMHALQWVLYGDVALPGKGKGFRLHPIDWREDDGKKVPITGTVEFETIKHHRVADTIRENRQRYRLVRSTYEDADDEGSRSASVIKLYALNETGSSPIEAPESLVNEELPQELREVFFTDGDRALSFIEGDVSTPTRRSRVQRAVRSLLGLGIIESAINHVSKSSRDINQKAKQVNMGSEVTKIATDLEDLQSEKERLQGGLEDADEQFQAFDEKLAETERKISDTLKEGDEEKLSRDFDQIKGEIKQLDEQLLAANKDHSSLFRGCPIAKDMLFPVIEKATQKLEVLHSQGKIPSTTVPVLQERLLLEDCICGETLDASDPDGTRRRAHIQKLIDDSKRSDEVQKVITDLYFGSKPLQDRTSTEDAWLEEYKAVVERRDGIQRLRGEAGRRFRALEQQLASLPDTDIQGLRELSREYKGKRDYYLGKKVQFETQLSGVENSLKDLEFKRDTLLRQQKKGESILAQLNVTQDVKGVLDSAYDRITDEEVRKVSDLMNGIFLEMIGADPEQGAIVQRAEIGSEFDILVFGMGDKPLNPDVDLNGASRRALTLSFILALTKVSEVEAPNVIDTPLGMTSGFVKSSILRTSIRESSQLVLFLTHDEISGCEDIIDEEAGIVITLTNPAHYPTMLANNPNVVERKIVRCECDHRSQCQLCERRTDVDIRMELAS